jgi:NADPH:quinone reductase-like Zn-dependent oxidoreductase
MKAIQLLSYGDPVEGLALRDVAEPSSPGRGEVLVGVRYAPINVSDLMVALVVYDWRPKLPEILGNEGAGVVLAVGPDVGEIAPGTPVVLPFMVQSWRERMVVRADALTILPREADLKQAAMATINAVTASMLLADFADLRPGEAVAYNAATSGLGRWVAGLASRRGLRSVGLVRRTDDVARVRASGCGLVLVDDDQSLSDPRLTSLTIRLALDGVGGASAGRLATLLSPGGALVAYGAASHRPMEISAQHLIFKRLTVRGFFEGQPENRSRIKPVLANLLPLLEPGGIVQPITAIYPVSDLRDAVTHALRGGKVLLSFN